MVKLNQANFDKLIEAFNHNMTEIKMDVKWMKKGLFYLFTILTKSVGLLAKIAFF